MLHRQCEDTEANESDEEEDELEKEELELEEEETQEQHVELSDPGADDGIVIEAPQPEPEPEPTSKPTKSKPKKQAKKKKQKPAASQKAGNRKQMQPSASIQPLDDDHDHLDVASCISSSVAKTDAGEKCDECLAPMPNCPCEQDVRDSGYGSDPTSHVDSRTSSAVSSPEGSEVSCSDGLCNHDGHDEDSDGLAARNSYVSDLLFYGHQSQLDHKFSLLQMWVSRRNGGCV